NCGDPFQSDDANAEVVFATGLGSNSALELPTGTAVHLVPGSRSPLYFKLYGHLVNETGSAISGTNGIEVHQVADPSPVAHDVDMVMDGMGSFSIAAQQSMTVSGACFPTSAAPGYQWHIVGLWPHMLESGTHVSVTIGSTAILDTDYSYLDERNYVIPETVV